MLMNAASMGLDFHDVGYDKDLVMEETPKLKLNNIVTSTSSLLTNINHQITHCSREVNQVADFLAKPDFGKTCSLQVEM
ncbi:hypothetical protein HAX54_037092 [Datura stramonium]|uniref:RNase H type-1 domain-containing protein n=1 Tax=Datura stramonium TaxID=4076 RepID=A0ABS8SGP3_DATST|nr:hypothetical protein [Datura stramonium]